MSIPKLARRPRSVVTVEVPEMQIPRSQQQPMAKGLPSRQEESCIRKISRKPAEASLLGLDVPMRARLGLCLRKQLMA
jgi:hypothetical protein